jgi:hypothetical protein
LPLTGFKDSTKLQKTEHVMVIAFYSWTIMGHILLSTSSNIA